MANDGIRIKVESLRTYEACIDDRIMNDLLQPAQIYTLMMRAVNGRFDAFSTPVSLDRIIKAEGRVFASTNFLGEKDFRPVSEVGAFFDTGHWSPVRWATFSEEVFGEVHQGYLLPHRDELGEALGLR